MQQGFDFHEQTTIEQINRDAVILRGFANSQASQLLIDSDMISRQSPYRHMTTPGGGTMSVAISNCGHCGWISDHNGYRYEETDPLTHRAWPTMPESFIELCSTATKTAGFAGFEPDACLLNRYEPNTKMGLHQDSDEQDFTAPIVSVSLGFDAVFVFGGQTRESPTKRYLLNHGDVVVFGGQSRLNFHGISLIKPTSTANDSINYRLNLTFRKVY